VDAFASNDVWAVGYSTHSGRQRTLIERWNGTQWRVVTSPNAGTSGDNVLTGVAVLSSTNAWAVGSSRTATSHKSLIQRWNDTSWTIVSSPNPGTLSNSLLGVAAVAPNLIWAVGWKNSGNGLQFLLLHPSLLTSRKMAMWPIGWRTPRLVPWFSQALALRCCERANSLRGGVAKPRASFREAAWLPKGVPTCNRRDPLRAQQQRTVQEGSGATGTEDVRKC
jgi:hypothetical protein